MSSSKYGIPRWLLNEVAKESEKIHVKKLCKAMNESPYSWNIRTCLSDYRRKFIDRYSKTFDHGICKVRCSIRNYDDGIYFLEPSWYGGFDEVRRHDKAKLPKKGDIITWFGRGYDMPEPRLNYFMDCNGRVFRLSHSSILKISKIED